MNKKEKTKKREEKGKRGIKIFQEKEELILFIYQSFFFGTFILSVILSLCAIVLWQVKKKKIISSLWQSNFVLSISNKPLLIGWSPWKKKCSQKLPDMINNNNIKTKNLNSSLCISLNEWLLYILAFFRGLFFFSIWLDLHFCLFIKPQARSVY